MYINTVIANLKVLFFVAAVPLSRAVRAKNAQIITSSFIILITLLAINIYLEVEFKYTSVFLQLFRWIDLESLSVYWALQIFFGILSLFVFISLILVIISDLLLMFPGLDKVKVFFPYTLSPSIKLNGGLYIKNSMFPIFKLPFIQNIIRWIVNIILTKFINIVKNTVVNNIIYFITTYIKLPFVQKKLNLLFDNTKYCINFFFIHYHIIKENIKSICMYINFGTYPFFRYIIHKYIRKAIFWKVQKKFRKLRSKLFFNYPFVKEKFILFNKHKYNLYIAIDSLIKHLCINSSYIGLILFDYIKTYILAILANRFALFLLSFIFNIIINYLNVISPDFLFSFLSYYATEYCPSTYLMDNPDPNWSKYVQRYIMLPKFPKINLGGGGNGGGNGGGSNNHPHPQNSQEDESKDESTNEQYCTTFSDLTPEQAENFKGENVKATKKYSNHLDTLIKEYKEAQALINHGRKDPDRPKEMTAMGKKIYDPNDTYIYPDALKKVQDFNSKLKKNMTPEQINKLANHLTKQETFVSERLIVLYMFNLRMNYIYARALAWDQAKFFRDTNWSREDRDLWNSYVSHKRGNARKK